MRFPRTVAHRGGGFTHGATMKKTHPLIGKRFVRLVVLRRSGTAKFKSAILECLCDCGKLTYCNASYLRQGETKSCGCLKIDRQTVHGGHDWPEYRVWANMKDRCRIRKGRIYDAYGNRGITVCAKWKTFSNFLADMGRRPSPKHSIERKDVNGNYEPGNCVWATIKEQANNKRKTCWVEVGGVKMGVAQCARIIGVHRNTLRYRLKTGWDHSDAISVQPRHQNRHHSHFQKIGTNWVKLFQAREND